MFEMLRYPFACVRLEGSRMLGVDLPKNYTRVVPFIRSRHGREPSLLCVAGQRRLILLDTTCVSCLLRGSASMAIERARKTGVWYQSVKYVPNALTVTAPPAS
jgi:hypothetical protein